MKTLLFTITVLLAATPTILNAQVRGKALEKIPDCTMIQAAWADGDSFFIRTSHGVEHRIRLYWVDCLETTLTDDNDARRLREQRRYFGISEAGGSSEKSIELALEYGKRAAAETAKALAEPFTIHTTFADGRGDPRFPRIYAFVKTADGEDLGELLVRKGLARAHGLYRETPDGQHRDVYEEKLRDLELIACRMESGIWVETDCEKLPKERELERKEDDELGIGQGPKKIPPGTIFDLNTAARDELMMIPRVGEKTANLIIADRPYANIQQLGNVKGIGPKTLEELKKHVRIGGQKGNPAKP